jgi:hypothetical protein
MWRRTQASCEALARQAAVTRCVAARAGRSKGMCDKLARQAEAKESRFTRYMGFIYRVAMRAKAETHAGQCFQPKRRRMLWKPRSDSPEPPLPSGQRPAVEQEVESL